MYISIFLNIVLLIFLSSCASMWGGYHPRTNVRIQHDRTYQPMGSNSFEVKDENIVVKYLPDIVDSGTSVSITNLTNKPLKIVWNETTHTGPSGHQSKVFHSGVKIIDRGQSLPPTLIPPNATINDDIIPINGVEWSETLGQWVYLPLCGKRSTMMHTLEDDHCIARTFSLYITYEVSGKKAGIPIQFKYIKKSPKSGS